MTALTLNTSLADTFYALASRYGDRPAMVSGQRTISYRQLAESSARSARLFQEAGVRAGDRVGVALRDSVDVVLSLVGLWMADAVAVSIDFRSRKEERETLALEFDLAKVLEDRPNESNYASIVFDSSWREALARKESGPLNSNITGKYPALISLTSGTTGKPLGIVMRHHAILARALCYGLECDYPMGGRYLNAFPLSFSASRNHTIGNLLRGATIYFHPPTFGAGELIERANSIGATFLFAVPSTVKAMLEIAPPAKGHAMPGLAMLYCGGSGMPSEDKLAAADRLTPGFLHCFSSSMTGTCSILMGADLQARPDTDGRILPMVRAEVVDDEDRIMPAGEVGAMRIRSHGMAERLYNDKARDSGDKIRDGWAYTGDLARISADGFLSVVGRTSDMIIRGGANVYPAEVEAALVKHPHIKEAAVTGYSNLELGEEIAAFVVTSMPLSEADIVSHCRVTLPPDKRPRKFVFLESLPRNASGKVMIRELRDRL